MPGHFQFVLPDTYFLYLYFRAWVPSEYSGFLLQSKDVLVRLIGDSKLPLGVNVSISGCLFLYVSPVMN